MVERNLLPARARGKGGKEKLFHNLMSAPAPEIGGAPAHFSNAPRMYYAGMVCPTLGGIPLLARRGPPSPRGGKVDGRASGKTHFPGGGSVSKRSLALSRSVSKNARSESLNGGTEDFSKSSAKAWARRPWPAETSASR